jgi:hypothetical protein
MVFPHGEGGPESNRLFVTSFLEQSCMVAGDCYEKIILKFDTLKTSQCLLIYLFGPPTNPSTECRGPKVAVQTPAIFVSNANLVHIVLLYQCRDFLRRLSYFS